METCSSDKICFKNSNHDETKPNKNLSISKQNEKVLITVNLISLHAHLCINRIRDLEKDNAQLSSNFVVNNVISAIMNDNEEDSNNLEQNLVNLSLNELEAMFQRSEVHSSEFPAIHLSIYKVFNPTAQFQVLKHSDSFFPKLHEYACYITAKCPSYTVILDSNGRGAEVSTVLSITSELCLVNHETKEGMVFCYCSLSKQIEAPKRVCTRFLRSLEILNSIEGLEEDFFDNPTLLSLVQ
ncbi:unnamed protein product [Moneuplotes crassus]|uniref:Uncharacterized protein n=1 Tax=Euplotes crassus TaxID=5936 RepID=A0AAD1UDE9_EUPCR|nr:unnamed protein product [Moneuplotes crassus]